MGRNTHYTAEVATEICKRLAMGESLRSICKSDGMPPESTAREWVIDDREGFTARYRAARDIGLDCMADEILDIADDTSHDTIIDANGNPAFNKEWVTRSRLRVDTRKWYLCKLAPKTYGDKIEQIHKGDPSAPLQLLLNGSDVHG